MKLSEAYFDSLSYRFLQRAFLHLEAAGKILAGDKLASAQNPAGTLCVGAVEGLPGVELNILMWGSRYLTTAERTVKRKSGQERIQGKTWIVNAFGGRRRFAEKDETRELVARRTKGK